MVHIYNAVNKNMRSTPGGGTPSPNGGGPGWGTVIVAIICVGLFIWSQW